MRELAAIALAMAGTIREIEAALGRLGGDLRVRWSPREELLLRKLYHDAPAELLVRTFGRPARVIAQKARALGLRRSAEFVKRTCFPPGHVPANKGLRRPGWAPGRMRETQFKKGQMPYKWVPIGTEVVDPDGYRKRKITDDRTVPNRFNWGFVHVLLWEQAHGPVPPGHAVAFVNHDKRDIRLDNLELVTRAELMSRNTLHNYPKPIAELIQLRGVLTRQIRKRERRSA